MYGRGQCNIVKQLSSNKKARKSKQTIKNTGVDSISSSRGSSHPGKEPIFPAWQVASLPLRHQGSLFKGILVILQLGCWRRLLRVLWTARRSNQSILKEINPEYSLEGLMLKLKVQYSGHLMQRAASLEKTDAGKDWRQEKGMIENEMVGWHHRLNGHEFEQALGDGEG